MSERATLPMADWVSELEGVAPVCEFADFVGLTWKDPVDQACEGLGAWLLCGAEDASSAICDKHAGLIRERLDLASYGARLEPS